MYCSRCSTYQCECEDYPIETEIRDLKITIQSLEQEVARLKEENLGMRNWKNCKEQDSCTKPFAAGVIICPCNKWEIKK